MNRKTLIKALAFIAGLYFVLEFLLPEKIGGEFDQYEVGSPAAVADGRDSYLVWYVGHYRSNQSAVGLLRATSDGTVERHPQPVLRRSVLRDFDQRGFAALAVAPEPTGLRLYYLGRQPSGALVLCHATSTAGERGEKPGPVPLLQQPDGEPATPLVGRLTAFAVTPGEAAATVFVAVKRPDGVNAVLRGTALVDAPLRWVLNPTPLTLDELQPAIEVHTLAAAPGGEDLRLWVGQNGHAPRVYALDGGAPALLGTATLPERSRGLTVLPHGDGYIAWYGEHESLTAAPTPESSRARTAVVGRRSADGLTWVALAPAEDAPAVVPGARGQPTYLSRALPKAGQSLQIIGAFALGLAVVNLVIMHGRRVAKVERGTHNSLAFFLAFVTMFVFVYFGKSEEASPFMKSGFDFMFNNLQRAMSAAVFSMITFYMISAAYRAFRVRSVEAAIMMGSAAIVMLGGVPLGEWLTSWIPEQFAYLRLPRVADTLLNVANGGAYRGVLFGIIVGTVATSLRMWLGLDENVYRGVDSK